MSKSLFSSPDPTILSIYIGGEPLSNMYSPEESNAISALIDFQSLNDLFGDTCDRECE